MKIENFKLIRENGDAVIDFKDTPNHSGNYEVGLPDTIVIHYTGGASLDSSVSWLTNTAARASAHFVIGKDGKIVQLAPLNVVTWHAGESEWKNRKWLNRYSIGIEIDNAGLLERRAAGFFTSFNKRIDDDKVVLAIHKNGHVEQGWEAFTPEQINTVEALCMLLIKLYSIKDIVGHDDIAPTRKVDPGPAFPLKKMCDRILLGRKDAEENEIPETEEPNLQKGIVTADLLNIRANPSAASLKVSEPLPRGTKVKILEKQGDWYKVSVDLKGWVSAKWVR